MNIEEIKWKEKVNRENGLKDELIYVAFNRDSFCLNENCISNRGILAYCYGKLLSKHLVISKYRRTSQCAYSARI
jgi:hypothetical protein